MKVTINREECICCGVCWGECPEVFEENSDDELSCIVEKYRVEGKLGEGEVDDNLKECVVSAADACPVEIIDIK